MDAGYRSSNGGSTPGTSGRLAGAEHGTSFPAAAAQSQAQQSQQHSADSLRYLSWYSAMIVSHCYVLEQAFLQQHPHGALAHGGDPVMALDAWSVMDAPGAMGGVIERGTIEGAAESQQETGDSAEAEPTPPRSIRRPSAILFTWWGPSAAAAAEGVDSGRASEALVTAFDSYFFPSYLFQSTWGAGAGQAHDHPHHHPSAQQQQQQQQASSHAAGGAATEVELRAAFRAFLELGSVLAMSAFADGGSASTAGATAGDSAAASGGGGGSAALASHTAGLERGTSARTGADVYPLCPSTANAVRTLLCSLAFNCPCWPLACAAQLLLAAATARLSLTTPLTPPGVGGSSRVVGRHPAAVLMELLPRVLPPGQPPRRPPGPREDALTYTPRSGETLFWVDAGGTPHLVTAEMWLPPTTAKANTDPWLVTSFEAAVAVACAALPKTATLPAVNRLLLTRAGLLTGELAGLERAMEVAADACAREAASAFARGGGAGAPAGSTRRRRVTGNPDVRSPLLVSPAALSATAAGTGAAPEPAPTSTVSRQKLLLSVLSRCHILVPKPQRALADELLYSIFTEYGECPGYLDALALYPDILRAHYTSARFILFDEGPLPLDERLMIAIMAASRHRCAYLVCRYAALLTRFTAGTDASGRTAEAAAATHGENLTSGATGGLAGAAAAGGSASRLEGHGRGQEVQATSRYARWLLDGPPPRLRAVQRLIALAAHTPWRVDEEVIRRVLRSGWTVPEVFQLAAIVAHVVPLAGLVMGLGVPVDTWALATLPPTLAEQLTRPARSNSSGSTTTSGSNRSTGRDGGGAGVSAAAATTTTTTTTATAVAPRTLPRPGSPSGAGTRASRFDTCPAPGPPEAVAEDRSGGGGGSPRPGDSATVDLYTCYAGADNIVSEQRIKGGTNSVSQHTLWRSQFSWQEVGATYMEQYYPGAAGYLNEEFDAFADVVRQLSEDDCVSLKYPQVTPVYAFDSLRLYVLNVLGYMVEDYTYNEINKVLMRPAKWIAQALTMRPEALSHGDVRGWATCASSLPPTATSPTNVEPTRAQEAELLAAARRAPSMAAMHLPTGRPGVPPAPAPAHSKAEDSDGGESHEVTAEEAAALTSALDLQDNRVLLLIMLATMLARQEGLLHIVLYPLCSVLSNM